MKKKVISLVVCLLFTVGSFAAFAQDGQSGGDGAENPNNSEELSQEPAPNCTWYYRLEWTFTPLVFPYVFWAPVAYQVCD